MRSFEDKNKNIVFETEKKCSRLKCSQCDCMIVYENTNTKVIFIQNLCNIHKNETKETILSVLQEHYKQYLSKKNSPNLKEE